MQTIGTYSALGVFRAAKHEKRLERNETRLGDGGNLHLSATVSELLARHW